MIFFCQKSQRSACLVFGSDTIHCIAHAALLLKGLRVVVRLMGLLKGILICKCYQKVCVEEGEATPSIN